MGRLDGKAAVVTGGAGLLGADFCRQLASEGASILLNDIAADRAQEVADEITRAGGTASVFEGSVDSWENGGRIVDACVARYGRLDCLVNSAHATMSVPLVDLDEQQVRSTLDTHVMGHFACTHHAVHQMIGQGGGSVINLISRAMQGMRGLSAYGAAKGAILSATFTWALELERHGIRVNAVSPAARHREAGEAISYRMPWRRSPGQSIEEMRAQTPSPESVAPLIVYLASDAADWISGQAIFLAGDSLALIRHPMEHHLSFRPEGWNVEDLERHFREQLGSKLEHPSMQAAPYAWHAGIGKSKKT